MDVNKVNALRAKMKKLAQTRIAYERQKLDAQVAYNALQQSEPQKTYTQAKVALDAIDEKMATLEKEIRDEAAGMYDPTRGDKKIPGLPGVTITEHYAFKITDTKAALEWAEKNMKSAIVPASLNERALASAVRQLDVEWGEKKTNYSARLDKVEQYLDAEELADAISTDNEEYKSPF